MYHGVSVHNGKNRSGPAMRVMWVQHSEIGSLITKGTGLKPKLGPGVRQQLVFPSLVPSWLLSLIMQRTPALCPGVFFIGVKGLGRG